MEENQFQAALFMCTISVSCLSSLSQGQMSLQVISSLQPFHAMSLSMLQNNKEIINIW
jgi:hypothetical protein